MYASEDKKQVVKGISAEFCKDVYGSMQKLSSGEKGVNGDQRAIMKGCLRSRRGRMWGMRLENRGKVVKY